MACTITGAGISAVHDNVITSTKLADGAITPAKFTTASKPLGLDQTWQTFTSAQRVFGTTYTNDTGRPITVMAGCTSSASGYLLLAIIDGVALTAGPWCAGSYSSVTNIVVPPGSTYIIKPSAGTATFNTWAELR